MESTKPRKQKVEPGPEHPTDESQAGVSYLSFDDLTLPLLQTEEDQNAVIGQLLEVASTCHLTDADWKAQYEAVNMMRALNKYNRELLLAHLDKLAKFIRQQIDNLRSNLVKNSLLFLKEFSAVHNETMTLQSQNSSDNSNNFNNINDSLRSFITIVYPVALIKTIYEKNFIVVEAKQSMSNAVQNLLYPDTIEVLVEGCRAKNLQLAEYSITYLTTLVKNMDAEFFLSGSQSVAHLIQQLQIEQDGKRMKLKKSAETIFSEIKSKIGKERIQTIIEESFREIEGAQEKINKIMKLFEEKVVKKADLSKDFRSFLKQQKHQVSTAFETSSTSSMTNDIPNPNDQMIIQ